MSTFKHRAAGATLWSTLEIAARYGAQFIVMVILARLLSPEDFGLVAILLVFTTLGMLLVDGGFGTALIQRQNTSIDDETTVFVFNLAAGILAGALLFCMAPVIAKFFDQPQLCDLTRLMALVLPLGALAAVPDALLAMKLDFKARARAEVVASICAGLLAIVLAVSGFGVWSLAWHSVTGIFIRGVLLWHFSAWRPRGAYSNQSFRSLFSFGAYMLAASLLNALAMRLQSLLIGKLFDTRTLGYYTLAQNTQQAPTSLVGNLLNRVGLPVFSTISGDRQRLALGLQNSMRMSMFLFFPFMIGISFAANPLISILYGEQWAPAAPILSILSLSAALWPMHVLNIAVIGAQGKSNLLLRVETVKQAAAIALIVISARWGVLAIAWSVVASSVVALAVNAHYCGRLLGYGLIPQLRDQSTTLFLTIAAALTGWAVLHWTDPSPVNFLFATAVAATAYLLIALLTRNAALAGVISMMRAMKASVSTSSS